MIENMKVWFLDSLKVVFKPTQVTFDEVCQNAKGRFVESLVWIIITSSVINLLNHQISTGLIEIVLWGLIIFPVGISLLVFWIHTVYQKVFRRKKNKHDELMYCVAMIFVATTWISFAISHIPEVSPFISRYMWIIQLVLGLLAVRSITKLNVWQSLITLLISLLLAAVSIGILPFCISSLYGSTVDLM
jgi:hypothetical protein